MVSIMIIGTKVVHIDMYILSVFACILWYITYVVMMPVCVVVDNRHCTDLHIIVPDVAISGALHGDRGKVTCENMRHVHILHIKITITLTKHYSYIDPLLASPDNGHAPCRV